MTAAFADVLVVLRGGGDLASGAAWRLKRAGFPLVVCELDRPLTVRRSVDARMAKRALDTTIEDAPLVIALGPGFTAGTNCHAVVETMRGPQLGRVHWSGSAAANTGAPGAIAGRGAERVLRAPTNGEVHWRTHIGDIVSAGTVLGTVERANIRAPFNGLVRGLLADSTPVHTGLKIGDIDPRTDTDWRQLSDKALAIGGGVLEAVLTWLHDRS
jgi:xanthine dehydrogenase accessory factor